MKRSVVVLLTLALLFSLSSVAQGMEKRADKKAVVLAAFGTSVPAALKAILNIKARIEAAFPGLPVRLAFTSEIIRRKWHKRAGDLKWQKANPGLFREIMLVKSPLAAIADLQELGYNVIAVQSLHVFAGEEYADLKAVIRSLGSIQTIRAKHRPFKKLVLGRPALGEPGDAHEYAEDIARAARALESDANLARKSGTALVYMGHGNEVYSTGAYLELEAAMGRAYPELSTFIGVVEGFPSLDRVMKEIKRAGAGKVTLAPLMVVAGDHAMNDMAGDEEDSWKTVMKKAGLEVRIVRRGLGELDAWADIYVQHLKDVMKDHGI